MHYSTSSLFNMTVAVSAFVMMMAFFGSVPPVHGFTLTAQPASQSMAAAETRQCLTLGMAADDSSGADPNEIVGKRIIVTGDVNGGYLRTCISNEAGRFRRLLGTMSPPDDEGEAEIYVEGKRKMIDGFIRWCQKGDKSVGLSQRLTVKEVIDEEPTGLYDGFYVRTGRD
mmetsp:Transcript_13205/g.31287  ORF Transcript_13205/g.31287 Transcript_13205/m.31287 type:complete len:170 (+) Transcript_13205:125-634(+)